MAPLHPDNATQKQRLLTAPHWLCIERARHWTAAYRATEGQPPPLRAAHALARVFAHMTLRIEPDELLVGNRASRPIAPPIAVERGDLGFVLEHLLPELEAFGYRIAPADRRELLDEILPYWRGKTVRDAKIAAFRRHGLSSPLVLTPRELLRKVRAFGPSALLRLVYDADDRRTPLRSLARLPRRLRAVRAGAGDNVRGRGRCIDTQAHLVLGHATILRLGFAGIAEAARARREAVTTADQRAFLESVEVSCAAVRAFSERFAAEAEATAARTVGPRRDELLAIAARCRRVPWLPARTFPEAVQAVWFAQNAAIIAYGAGSGIAPGRLDQLLHPFFAADLAAGTLTRDGALRLIEELLIKLNDNVVVWPNIGGVRLNHLGSDVENVTLGGLDRSGQDATNELTHLFVEAVANTKLATTVSFRISPKSPPGYVREVVALHRETSSPAFLNDETAIAALVRDGHRLEDARDYCLVGCVEPSGHGDSYGATGGSKVYFPTALDLVFGRGRTAFFGHRDGVDTGDPRAFQTFSELLAAYHAQLEAMVGWVADATNLRDAIWAERFPCPLVSATLEGCVERGVDMTRGGARYNAGCIGGGGLGTVVDSLAALRTFVFERRVATMADVVAAVASDFRGREPLRRLLAGGPRFGNDLPEVDGLARELVERFCAMVSARSTVYGGRFKASLISYGLNVYEGALEPATPDGRRAGAPLSNSMSPSNGAERRGPTAVLNSAARIDQTRIGYGNSLNMRLPLGLLSSDKGVDSVAHLVRTYFGKGGYHVQFNAVDTATLRAAQARPDDYPDLVVRVSGYSAYFTRLGRSIQDDLIARAELVPC